MLSDTINFFKNLHFLSATAEHYGIMAQHYGAHVLYG